MKDLFCDQEAEVTAALRRGNLDPELLEHASTCGVCADILAVCKSLQTEAKADTTSVLPDPATIWRRAELRSRSAAADRAAHPIQIVNVFALLAGAIATLWFVTVKSPMLFGWINSHAALDHLFSRYWTEVSLEIGAGSMVCGLVGALYYFGIGERRVAG
jgi:hypothetical protein